jgi:uncharacterized protein (TIGR02246 family)
MSADERAIRDVIQRWMDATKAGDLDTVLSLMADDVVFMTPGREPFGKQEFAAASRSMSGMKIEGESTPVEIKVLGDWAYVRNRIKVSVTPSPGAQMQMRSGYTLSIFSRQPDGRWLLARDANLLS